MALAANGAVRSAGARSRLLWALAACGGAAGLVVVERRVREQAAEHAQSTRAYVEERMLHAADTARNVAGVAGVLAGTAVGAAFDALHQRRLDKGQFNASMASAVADLAADPGRRRQLVAFGGGYFLDWLLELAYPGLSAGGGGGTGGGLAEAEQAEAEARLGRGGAAAAAEAEGAAGSFGGLGAVLAAAGGAAGSSRDAERTAVAVAAERAARRAERALEALLWDDAASEALLERPGAVPRLLGAVAAGAAAPGVEAALVLRAGDAGRRPREAMTADLRDTVEVLRGRRRASLPLQRLAAGFLAAWAAGGAASRAKLTGLGVQAAAAEAATAVSGMADAEAVGLQWELLRLTRVLAEHTTAADCHHLAACLLPLLYTAADAAAARDGPMATYAVHTLAAAVRHGGQPVAERVGSSTAPHLLWQLAKDMGAHRRAAAGGAGGGGAKAGGKAGSKAAAAAAPAPAGVPEGKAAAQGKAVLEARAARAGGSSGVGGAGDAGIEIKDPAVAAAVARAVAELAAARLLPEPHVPKWRDWLLDLLCADGFAPSGAPAAAAAAGGGGAAVPSPLREAVVAALSALSHVPGNHGLQAAHYWLARLLSELAAATLPYTSLVYGEGRSPRDPADLVHVVPVLPSYVRSVADALQRAADAVAADEPSPPIALALEFDPAGSGLGGGRHSYTTQPKHAPAGAGASAAAGSAAASGEQGGAQAGSAGRTAAAASAAAAEAAAVTASQHVVDVVVAERKAADALEALCAIVAPDPAKAAWLLHRGALPLLHRLTHSADDPTAPLTEEGQPGAEAVEAAQARAASSSSSAAAEAAAADAADAAAVPVSELLSDHEGGPSLCLQRQVARMLALLALLPEAQRQLRGGGSGGAQGGAAEAASEVAGAAAAEGGEWLPWLRHAATSSDCRLSSNATRALLHVAAVAANPAAAAAAAAASPLAAAAAPPVFLDGVHLLDPAAPHHWALVAAAATAAAAADAAAAAAQVPAGAGARAAGAARIAGTGGAAVPPQRQSPPGRKVRGMALAEAVEAAAEWTAHADGGSGGRSEQQRPGLQLLSAATNGGAAGASAGPPGASSAPHSGPAGSPSRGAVAALRAGGSAASASAAVERCADGPGGGAAPALLQHAAALGPRQQALGAALPVAARDVGVRVAPASAAAPPLPPPTPPQSPPPQQQQQQQQQPASGMYGILSYMLGAVVPFAWSSAPAVRHEPTSLAAPGATAAAPGTSAARAGAAAATPGQLQLPPPPRVAAASAAEPPQSALRLGGNTGNAAPPTPSAPSPQPHATVLTPAPAPAAHPASAADPAPTTRAHSTASPPAPRSAPAKPPPAAAASSPPAAPVLPPYPAPYPAVPDDTPSSPPPHALTADTATITTAAPLVDVVFIHGIRGGPFITWRKAGVAAPPRRAAAVAFMDRASCWPSTWLREDAPYARLLSVEYLAPVSAWEGESLPLEDNVLRVMAQLAAAGVGTGARPVVFVAHSMGGLLVKEMLARSMEAAEAGGPHAALAPSTRGVVFYGTPHFGNGMAAMGWRLRHVPGAHPAPSLARLTPGPHLMLLNDRLRELHEQQAGGLRVVSVLEGSPTVLSGVIPRITIVPPDSAYPGFGAALTLPHNDHIDVCKPAARTAAAYRVVLHAVLHAVRFAGGGGGGGGAAAGVGVDSAGG